MSREEFDVVVVGAGISGIGAAHFLRTKCPDRSFVMLEARERLGGTWDLFRYPGIRSDSDMYTLGFSFRPWKDRKSIADGATILSYLEDTAAELQLDDRIRYRHKVKRAAWSSDDARWHVTAERGDGTTAELRCRFLYMCSGYYDYDAGYTPELAGRERFRGAIVHPQQWTDNVDYDGKRVIVIGSGATAVTLVPQLSRRAEHVTMLQRTPSYVVSVPAEDPAARWLREKLPERAAYHVTRWKNILIGAAFFALSRRAPDWVSRKIKDAQRARLGPEFDVDTHFSPPYKPWDQRVCLIPDADLYRALQSGKVSMVTDHIDTFTETGLLLKSGRELVADLIVTATGLRLKFLAGVELTVDGEPVDVTTKLTYKAMMLSDVPNMAMSFGYTNASWTLKSDLTGEYVARLLNHMTRHGYRRCVPRLDDPRIEPRPFLDFSSGYVQRALPSMPKQGSRAPWQLYQNYLLDLMMIRYGKIADGTLRFD